ncbi:ABC transporter ATP-binding protein [Deinococcus radiotolerans]|uniref:ABC transporter domain-containing protein n=1 Tax=Deinococcus radiotolerans TaxID=1309407 RepID=A0ABQ2FG65_9DEIO|nr:ATP-binding cassette domain-containing protein [Deinococcus radiotolerans]GGK86191.1 hypothetical protein GCM10010844_00870 [Deinococcus radiotolerans]
MPPAAPVLSVPPFTLEVAGRPLARVPGVQLQPGEVLHLCGPNGAGKTTLLRVLAGERPDLGCEVRVLGCAPGSRGARKGTAWVPTDAALPDDLTVAEGLTFLAALWSRPVTPLLALADALGLTGWLDAWPTKLSRGTRQKVALSGALGLGCALTLLDEPFGTLDAASRAALRTAIRARAQAGGALVVTTHGEELAGLPVQTLKLEPA